MFKQASTIKNIITSVWLWKEESATSAYYKRQYRQRRIRIGFLRGVLFKQIFTVSSISPGKPWGVGEGRKREERKRGVSDTYESLCKRLEKKRKCAML